MNKWNTGGEDLQLRTICVFVVALGRSPRVEGFTYAAATIAVTAVTTARSPLPPRYAPLSLHAELLF